MNEALLSCSGLAKIYRSQAEELAVLSDLELEVAAGESLAISGSSGSGKSTLLSLLGGLDRASAGRIQVGGYELGTASDRDLVDYRASVVGFVFQFHYLLKDFTALENVALPAMMRGEERRSALERAASLLGRVGLEARAGHFPSQLSGGERQRAAIARALINGPSLILADEPTGNLDAANASAVAELLLGLSGPGGASLVLVTHDPAFAARAGRRLVLREGRLWQD